MSHVRDTKLCYRYENLTVSQSRFTILYCKVRTFDLNFILFKRQWFIVEGRGRVYTGRERKEDTFVEDFTEGH